MSLAKLHEACAISVIGAQSLASEFKHVSLMAQNGNMTGALVALDRAERINEMVSTMLSTLNGFLGRRRGIILDMRV